MGFFNSFNNKKGVGKSDNQNIRLSKPSSDSLFLNSPSVDNPFQNQSLSPQPIQPPIKESENTFQPPHPKNLVQIFPPPKPVQSNYLGSNKLLQQPLNSQNHYPEEQGNLQQIAQPPGKFVDKLPDLNLQQEKNNILQGAPEMLPELKKSQDLFNTNMIPEFKVYKKIPEFEIEPEMPVEKTLPPIDIDEEPIDLDWRHKGIEGPLYVRTDKYVEVINTLDTITNYVKESSDIIYGLENLKKNLDIENREYKKTLEDIQRKIIYVDKLLFDRV